VPPALALAVVGDQPGAVGGAIQRALDDVLVERACSIVGGRAAAGVVPRRRGREQPPEPNPGPRGV
jgi:hypothetical protein